MENYQNYHNHKSPSNIYTADSSVSIIDYAIRNAEIGSRVLCSMEHGFQGKYFEVYEVAKNFCINYKKDNDYCNKCNKFGKSKDKCNNYNTGMKFVYGVEGYWVKDRKEDDSTNSHICILAKNNNGRKALNLALSEANETGYYYKPRLDLELILNLPENDVFLTSACLAFFKYPDIEDIIVKLKNKFKDNFMLEVQYHYSEKNKEVVRKILEISKKYNIKLIAGMDSHYIYEHQKIERDEVLLSKGIKYEDEEGFFMDYPDYNTAIDRFKKQDILSENEIIEAMNNTNLILGFEDYEEIEIFKKNIKLPTLYPNLSQEEKNNKLKDIIVSEFRKKNIPKDKINIYNREIAKEFKIIKDTNMTDYFLLDYEIIKEGKKNGGIITTSGRGCFTKDALVLTENNLKPINEIQIGDKVVSEDGRFNKVIDTFEYDIEEDMVEFQYEKQGSSYKKYINMCTLDHKILTKDGWKQAKDLTLKDKLCCPKIKYDEKDIVYDLVDYNFQNYEYDDKYIYEYRPTSTEYKYSPKWLDKNYGIGHNWLKKIISNKDYKICKKEGFDNYNKLFKFTNFKTIENYRKYCLKHGFIKNKIPRFIKMDYIWNLFIGMMYGDGWTHNDSGLGFAINNTTKNGINKYVFYKIAEKINMGVYVNASKKKNLTQLFILSKIMNNFFSTEFFKSKKKNLKVFNKELLSQRKENIKFLHMGLIRTDGSINKKDNKLCFDNTSLSLISAFKIMDNILKNPPLSLDVRLEHIDKRGFNNSESYKVRRSITPKKNILEEDENYFYLPVTKIINHKNVKTKVYDFSVENFRSYTINNIVVHNSAVSFYINNLLGFTEIDRIASKVKMFPERFMSKARILETKSLPDIDFNLGNPEVFYEAQNKIFGEEHSYPMIAYGTFKAKSAFKMYAKAKGLDFEISQKISNQIDEYEKELKYTEEDEKDIVDIYDFIEEQYREIYDKSIVYQGIISDKKQHPCGYLIYNKNIKEEIGLIRVKSESTGKDVMCCLMDGDSAEKFKFLKNDLLKVDVAKISYLIAEDINKKIPTQEELIDICNKNPQIFDIYKKGLTLGINQVESLKTRSKVMKYCPNSIEELCAFIAGIRPSFKSMYSKFEKREDFKYNIPTFDKIIRDTGVGASFILYQETIMAVLSFAGFEDEKTYDIIKAISKKRIEVIMEIKNKFIENMKSKFIENDKINEQEAIKCSEMVWNIIESSSAYGFNASHSYCMAYDSLLGAYDKTFHTNNFYKKQLQEFDRKKNKKKVSAFKEEMQKGFNIKFNLIKFKNDNREFNVDSEGLFNQPISSIKDMGKDVGERLYELSKQKKYYNFLDLLKDIKEQKVLQSNQLEILIKLDYFSEFGKSQYLLDIVSIYENFYSRKQISKSDLVKLNITSDIMERFSNKQTEKLYKEIDNEGLVKYLISELDDKDISLKEKLHSQKEYIGYIEYINDKLSDNFYYVLETKFYQSKNKPYLKLYRLKDGNTVDYRINDGFEFNTFKDGDIIKIIKEEKKNKSRLIDGKWVKLEGEFNNFVKSWQVL